MVGLDTSTLILQAPQGAGRHGILKASDFRQCLIQAPNILMSPIFSNSPLILRKQNYQSIYSILIGSDAGFPMPPLFNALVFDAKILYTVYKR